MKEENPEQFKNLMTDTQAYSKAIDKLHIYDWMLSEKLSTGAFLLRTLYAILLIPVLLYGLLNNFLPYNASVLVTRKIKDRMLHNSFHFAMGALVSFPVWFIAIFITVWCITHTWWIALLYLVSVPLSFVVYLRSKIIVKKQLLRFVRFGYWWRGNENFYKAKAMRAKLVETLDGLFTK
ncbi:MAG: hypothetical protein LBV46_00735 [Bacteroidales bacterium]|nr:hypothetical protein [Bacteroidales bacterium]